MKKRTKKKKATSDMEIALAEKIDSLYKQHNLFVLKVIGLDKLTMDRIQNIEENQAFDLNEIRFNQEEQNKRISELEAKIELLEKDVDKLYTNFIILAVVLIVTIVFLV